MNTHQTARRIVSNLLAASVALTVLPALAQASYPTRPVQMMVPFPAGGPVDVVARSFAQALDAKLNQRVVVLNRDGGSTTVAMNALLSAPADGYTVVYGPVTALTVHLHWMKGLNFKADSFTPICQTFENIFFLAGKPDSRYTSFESVVAQAKADPGKLTYGHPGISSSPHLAGAELFQRASVNATDIAFRGEAPLLPVLLGGQVDLGVVTTGLVATHNLKPLAVFADKRLPQYPNVPTVKELGYAVSPSGYGGLFVRSDVPADVISTLEKACKEAVADASFREMAQRQNQQADFLNHHGFKARINADYKSKEQLLKTVKLER